MSAFRAWLVKALPWITGGWVLLLLASLRLGLLSRFYFGSSHADVQGVDYFSLPKAFLNLANGRSAFAAFDPPIFGPHLTWYLLHPALAVWLGSWLSLFKPWTSYAVYTALSLSLMATCAWLIARQSDDALTRRLVWLLVMGAFPTYWLFFVGNVHGLVVLAVGMVLTAVFMLTYKQRGESLLLAGLVLSLLSKPVALPMLPLLLLLKETRRAAWRALAIYGAVSVAFELVPALNPEAIGLKQVAWLAMHPAFVRENMNIFGHGFVVNSWMRDNSFHWFNLIAQSQTRYHHVDILSLPVFLDTLTGSRLPGWLYELPILVTVALAFLVARIEDARKRMEAGLLLLMATSVSIFLGYATVWEYQYTSILPVGAMLLVLRERGVFYGRARRWMAGLAACAWLPTLYVFTKGDPPFSREMLLTIWVDRVLPVTALFCLMAAVLIRVVWKEEHSKLAGAKREPGPVSDAVM